MRQQIRQQLDQFLHHKTFFESQTHFHFQDLDSYGFSVGPEKFENSPIDFLICGLTHGNEVIGLEILNLLLQKILSQKQAVPIRVGFQLNNVEAALQNKRFLDYDLNRSFHLNSSQEQNLEFKRAEKISEIVKKARFILDIHQTAEPTVSSFFMLPDAKKIIQIAHALDPASPVVSFSASGFSKEGLTLMEHAYQNQVLACVIELSQNGFNAHQANQFSEVLLKNIFNFENLMKASTEAIPHFKIKNVVLANYGPLLPGLINFMQIKKGDYLTKSYQAQFDCVLLFPKYGPMAKDSHELCLLAAKVES